MVVTRYDELASKAPMSGALPASSPAVPRRAPRWSVMGSGTRYRRTALVDGGAAGEQGDRLGRAAISAQAACEPGETPLARIWLPLPVRPPAPPLPIRLYGSWDRPCHRWRPRPRCRWPVETVFR